MAFEKKTSSMGTSFKPASAPADAASTASKAPTVGVDTNASLGLSLPDTMTKIPKLPTGLHDGIPAGHAFNSARHAERFGTDTEKAKVKSDVQSNYGSGSDDCPSY